MTTIELETTLAAPREQVYQALTTAAAFSRLSGGAPAEISSDAGAEFSLFGGMIQGRNVECLAGERLVQAWRAKTWDAGVYSIVRFELDKADQGTRLRLVHAGFPDGQAEHLSKGWEANYLEPLKKL